MMFKRMQGWMLVGAVLLAGCTAQSGGNGGSGGGVVSDGGIPDDDSGRPNPPGTAGAFSALLSSTKTVLIRDDETEGFATLTAVSSMPATFMWSVSPQSAVDNNLVKVTERDPETLFDSTGAPVGSRSRFEINVIDTADPGSRGTEITVQVVASLEGGEEESTSSARLRIVRPETSLSMSASSGTTRIRPGETVSLRAEVIGGEPFVPGDGPVICGGPSTIGPQASHTTADFTGQDEDQSGPGYRIRWSFAEGGLSADNPFEPGELTIGCPASEDDAVVSEATYTAPNATGPVVVTVQAQDASGSRFTTTIPIIVQSLSELQIAQAVASQTSVAPGDDIELTAKVAGGEPPYRVEFETVGGEDNTGIPGGVLTHVSGGLALTREAFAGCQQMQEGDDVCVVRYGAPDDQEGAELIDVTVTDGLGKSVVNRIAFFVTAETELQLVAIADRARVLPTDTARIDAVFNGGTPPYTVTFEYFNDGSPVSSIPLAPASSFSFDPSPAAGCVGPEAINLAGSESVSDINDTNSLSVNYTAPAKVTVERVQVTVCDNVGDQVTDSVAFSVSPDQSLVVSASPSPSQIEPGALSEVNINVTAIGGTPPYTVTNAVLEAGGPGGSVSFNSSPFGQGGQSVVVFDPPNAVGVAVVRVNVSDSAGQSGTAFADITIIPNQALSADLTIASSSVDLNGCVQVTGTAVGGSGNFKFDFKINDNIDGEGCLFNGLCPAACTPGVNLTLPQITVTRGAPDNGAKTVSFMAPAVVTSNVIALTVSDNTSSVTVTRGVIIGASGQLAVVAVANPTTVLSDEADAGACLPSATGPVGLTSVVSGSPTDIEWSVLSPPASACVPTVGDDCGFADPQQVETGWCPGATLGQHVLQLRVEDTGLGLQDTSLVQVNVVEPLAITASPDVIVGPGASVSQGQPITLTQPVSSNPSALDYLWSFDMVPGATPAFQPNATSQTVSFTPPAVGTYSVRCTVSDDSNPSRSIDRTFTVTAVTPLAASPIISVDGVEVNPDILAADDCIVARPGMGALDGTIDAAHAVADVEAMVSGGIAPFTFSWSATLGGAANYVSATVENPVWNIPTIGGDVDNHAWTVTVTDATGNVKMGSVVRALKQPVRITSIFPTPAVGTVGNQLSLTFLSAVGSGTDPLTALDLVQTLGAGTCNLNVAFPASFTNPFGVGITCDTADAYGFELELTDGCSDAVITVPFSITINP